MTRYTINVLKTDFKKALQFIERQGDWWQLAPENSSDEKYIILVMNKCGVAELANHLNY